MEFRNLTPFDTLCFASVDASDQMFRTIVMRVGYRMTALEGGGVALLVMDQEPVSLCLQDEFRGEMNRSSVRLESDLAPNKPRCDVIVNATAYAPNSSASSRFNVHVQVIRPPMQVLQCPTQEATGQAAYHQAKLHSLKDGELLIAKHLVITGPRWLQQDEGHNWQLTAPTPIFELPICYEYAYGGECRINEGDPAAAYVPDAHLLPEAIYLNHPDAQAEPAQRPVAHTVCQLNPIGTGFVEGWYIQDVGLSRVPAPQIEPGAKPYTVEALACVISGSPRPYLEQSELVNLPPAGFGIIGRAWMPRRKLSGTYDRQWQEQRHPWLPSDFDFSYWNCAPTDQQVDHLLGCEMIRTLNLVPHDTPGATRSVNGDTLFNFALPDHRAFVLTRWRNGEMAPVQMHIDTLIVDLDQLQVDAVWRVVVPDSEEIRVVEARFEVDPTAPLLKFDASVLRAEIPEAALNE
jgi:hypothetical protein